MEQGSVLRRFDPKGEKYEEASQSLWNRAVSYDEKGMIAFELMKSQSLWNRAVSYDLHGDVHPQINARSQSLWNRAVSYDLLQKIKNLSLLNVSIPLEQGSVLRQIASNLDEGAVLVSIPLEQGSVLRQQWGHQALCDKACRSHFPTFSETQRVGS